MKKRRKFYTCEFKDVEFIRWRAGRRITVPVRGANDQQAFWPQHAPDLGQELILLEEMFKRLKRDDHIDTVVRQWNCTRVALQIGKIIPAELARRGLHHNGVDLYS